MTDDQASRRPRQFPPPFASAWGDDEFGLWAELSITKGDKTVKQKLRWIEPGTFWMGSPENEVERYENEGPRHLVTLTEGFWLADTACTQALWTMVMGSNPSRSRDDEQLPVENVSWEDVQQFLRALKAQLHDCDMGLPSEAQWEYACRAGTETPFSSVENNTSAEANYDGHYPYGGAPKSEYRARTVPVGSLPPNPWGLYEMHGNVWEWCADGVREYSEAAVVDPLGVVGNNSEFRVLRGGSWISSARWVRAASREANAPSFRSYVVGFRICSRSKKVRPQG